MHAHGSVPICIFQSFQLEGSYIVNLFIEMMPEIIQIYKRFKKLNRPEREKFKQIYVIAHHNKISKS